MLGGWATYFWCFLFNEGVFRLLVCLDGLGLGCACFCESLGGF